MIRIVYCLVVFFNVNCDELFLNFLRILFKVFNNLILSCEVVFYMWVIYCKGFFFLKVHRVVLLILELYNHFDFVRPIYHSSERIHQKLGTIGRLDFETQFLRLAKVTDIEVLLSFVFRIWQYKSQFLGTDLYLTHFSNNLYLRFYNEILDLGSRFVSFGQDE